MAALHLEGDQQTPDAEEVVAVLKSTLDPNNCTLDPSGAAVALNKLYLDRKISPSSFLWRFWDLLHDLSRQLPHDGPGNERLAATIDALHDLPPVSIHLDEDSEGQETQLWTALPYLGATLYEKWDGDQNAPEGSDKQQRFLNLQTYAARLAGYRLAPLEMYAIWALTAALEGTITPVRGAPDEVNPDPAAVEELPFKAAAAAAWIKYAGHTLYGRDEEIRGSLGGPLWKLDKKQGAKLKRKYRGTQGLCPERWALWKERFGAIRDAENVDKATRKVAAGAVEDMDRIEKSE
ncbi:hypothetical protein BX600DRAFT_513938 [Xylariales sp. PMI_506]|nr:hypothetical protein BX600DRAFT_513938 [Xylariales sp. PMI_506]